MGCGCKNKKKLGGEVVKVENGAPTEKLKVENAGVGKSVSDDSIEEKKEN